MRFWLAAVAALLAQPAQAQGLPGAASETVMAALKAMVVLPAISDPFLGGAYDSGAFPLAPGWPFENSGKAPREVPPIDEVALATLPLSALDETVFNETVPLWDRYLKGETRAGWKAPRWPQAVCASDARVLMFHGLWDGDGIGPVRNWEARQRCRPGRTALVMGPWGHSMAQNGVRGDVSYGDASKIGLMPLIADWFDRELRGRAGEAVATARVFVTGANAWKALESWPPRTGTLTLHLAPRTGATGAHRLSEAAVGGGELPIVYAPERTGRGLRAALFSRTTLMPEPLIQGDQLVFDTPPFTQAAARRC